MAEEIKLAQDSIDALAQALRGGNSAAPNPQPTATPSPGPVQDINPIVATLKEVADKLATVAGWMAKQGGVDTEKLKGVPEAATGVLALKDSSYGASKAIDLFASKVPVLGAMMDVTGLSLTKLLKLSQEGTKLGVGQGDPTALMKQAGAAGFKDADQMLDFFRQNYSNNMRLIGRNADDALQKYGDFAQKTLATDLGKRLINTNIYNADDIAKIAAIAAAGKTDMLRDPEGRRALAEKTGELAAKIDAQSKITGESRDAIIQNMLATQNSTKAQLEMQALSNDQERQNYLKNQQMFDGMGKDMQNVVGTIYAGGRLSKEQKATLQAATGGRGGQLIQLLREQRRTAGLADNDPMKIEADRKLREFMAGMNEYQKSQLFAQQAITTGNDRIRQAAFNAAEQNKIAPGQAATQRQQGVTAPQAYDRQINEALQNLRGYRQEGMYMGPGRQVPTYGAELYKELNSANEQVRKNAASAADALHKYNSELARNTDLLNDVRKANEAIAGRPKTQEENNKAVKDALDEAIRSTMNPGGATVPGTNPIGGVPNNAIITPKTRGTGTLGETGLATEPKDDIVKIHKGETVLTPDQKNDMIKDSANAAIDKMLGKSNPRDPENQEVRYKNVDKNAPEFVEMRRQIEAERAERAKYTRTREVNDPFYKGGKRWETYDIREEEAKQKAATEATPVTPPKPEVPKVESTTSSQNTVQNQYADLRNFAKQRKAGKSGEGAANEVNKAVIGMLSEIQSKMGIGESAALDKVKGKIFGNSSVAQQFKDFQPKVPTPPAVATEAAKAVDTKMVPKETVTLKDLNDQLIQLNSNIKQLVSHGSATAQFAEQQVKATKGLSGNRFA